MKLSSNEIRFRILKKLVRHRAWGTYHIDENDVPKSMPPELRKDIMKELDNLIKEGFIVRFPHSGKRRIYLNIHKKDEIEEILTQHL